MSRNNQKKNSTFADLITEGFAGSLIVELQLTQASGATYLKVLREHIMPALGHCCMEELEGELPGFVASLYDRGLSERAVHTVQTVLQHITEFAHERGLVEERLATSTDQLWAKAVECFSAEEASRITAIVANELERLMLRLMIDAGLSAYELAGREITVLGEDEA